MAKYNFKIQIGNKSFGIDGCGSFDEAMQRVERGVNDYRLAHPEEFSSAGSGMKEPESKTAATPAQIGILPPEVPPKVPPEVPPFNAFPSTAGPLQSPGSSAPPAI